MSLVFREIALGIIRRQDNGVADNIVGSLEKTLLDSMISKYTNDGQTKTILRSMTELYKHDALVNISHWKLSIEQLFRNFGRAALSISLLC